MCIYVSCNTHLYNFIVVHPHESCRICIPDVRRQYHTHAGLLPMLQKIHDLGGPISRDDLTFGIVAVLPEWMVKD